MRELRPHRHHTGYGAGVGQVFQALFSTHAELHAGLTAAPQNVILSTAPLCATAWPELNRQPPGTPSPALIGLGGKDRTCDLRNPNPARYQAALHPDGAVATESNLGPVDYKSTALPTELRRLGNAGWPWCLSLKENPNGLSRSRSTTHSTSRRQSGARYCRPRTLDPVGAG